MKRFICLLLSLLGSALILESKPVSTFQKYVRSFAKEHMALGIPGFTFEYREYFRSIPELASLEKQASFFSKTSVQLQQFDLSKMSKSDQLQWKQLQYEVLFNLQRIDLERRFVIAGRKIPNGGLHDFTDSKEWYAYFVKKYTSLDLSPDEIMKFGNAEVQEAQIAMEKIRQTVSIKDSAALDELLSDESFFLTNKAQLDKEFARVDSVVRVHLNDFVGKCYVPPIYPMEWPDAGPNTPPGIYLNKQNNAYGRDVFLYNFLGEKFNKRSLEWIYMHEAIPGHHLQFTINKTNNELDELFTYPGNFEGWACYVEDFGKELGLYNEAFSTYGKCEWDLVRSVRVVIDAGIHYFGWGRQQAMTYWKENIKGQDDIADREIARVTNWPGQTLSYKFGADFISKLKVEWMAQNPDKPQSKFHRAFLECGRLPLPIVKDAMINQPTLVYSEPGLENAYPHLSKDGQKILFQSNRTGKWQLFVLDTKDNSLKRIGADTSNNNLPDWSPDNKLVAYVSDQPGNEEVFISTIGGTEKQRITTDAGRDIHPYFSPDGKYILFNSTRGNGSFDIYRYTLATQKTERLTNTLENETCARYSPDMKRIVFLRNSNSTDDVFVLNLSNGLTDNVTNTPTIRDGWPMFGPKGDWIYYSTMANGPYAICRTKVDGSERQQLTFPKPDEVDARVNVSSNGSFLIYNKQLGATISIMRSIIPG